jgi:putative redox protein
VGTQSPPDDSVAARIGATGYAVEIEDDLTDEQHERLMEIADKCPVHRTLEGEIIIGPPEEN